MVEFESAQKERAFKGIWIPAKIWTDPNLTVGEKHILAEIDSFNSGDGCKESNASLGESCGLRQSSVSVILSRLSDKGWIEIVGKGKGRRIRPIIQNAESVQATMPEVNVAPKIDTIEMRRCVGRFIQTWKSFTGGALHGGIVAKYVKKLLTEHSEEDILGAFENYLKGLKNENKLHMASVHRFAQLFGLWKKNKTGSWTEAMRCKTSENSSSSTEKAGPKSEAQHVNSAE